MDWAFAIAAVIVLAAMYASDRFAVGDVSLVLLVGLALGTTLLYPTTLGMIVSAVILFGLACNGIAWVFDRLRSR